MGVRFLKGINSSNKFRFLSGLNTSQKIKFLKTITASIVEPTTNGLVARFKADAGITESGGVITSWADQSGGAGVATAYNGPTLITNQLNGRPAVYMNGIDQQYFTFSLNNFIGDGRTFIIIYKYNSMVGQTGILDTDNSDGYIFNYNSDLYYYIENNSYGLQIGPVSGDFISNYFVETVSTDVDTLTTLRINGIDKTSDFMALPVIGNFVIGARSSQGEGETEFVDANIVEILIYNRKLSNLEIQDVETYANVIV